MSAKNITNVIFINEINQPSKNTRTPTHDEVYTVCMYVQQCAALPTVIQIVILSE